MGMRDIRGFDPRFKREAGSGSHIEDGTGRDENRRPALSGIKIEGLAHFAGGKSKAALKRAMVRAGNVIGIRFRRPPADDS